MRNVMVFVVLLGLASAAAPTLAHAQGPPPTRSVVPCPDPENQDLIMPPQFVSSGGVLSGTIKLVAEFRRLPSPKDGQPCRGELLRVFKGEGEGLEEAPPAQPPLTTHADAIPGPTLRARVGDLVQLRFVNEIDLNRFDPNRDLDREACAEVGFGGEVYPQGGWQRGIDKVPRFQDTFPNCLHASSTANIHFHGTHTNPNGTGDNVYLQIRPLPRNGEGELTTSPAAAMAGFSEFFQRCAEQLRNPLNPWPATWHDVPVAWTDKQAELLKAYQAANPTQPLWDHNQAVMKESWPIFYIGAFPYCYALPAYTAEQWPPAAHSPSPVMGQAPGTHWYHAHKHGSTAINVANGMTGAFIIEGKYDDDLDNAYRGYVLQDGPWKARSGKVLVLNQLMGEAHPHAMTSKPTLPTPGGVDFSVNGRLRPRVKMQPGEVQLWRIINTSGRTAAYFISPSGLAWQQIAQDGVQYGPKQYEKGANLNKPFYMAPANRVDLLVQAPLNASPDPIEVRIQQVMGRSAVVSPADDPGTVLLLVEVTGSKVTRDGQEAQMPLLSAGGTGEARVPELPPFLRDITDEELRRNNSITRTLVFNSKKPVRGTDAGPSMAQQHTIDGVQFGHPSARIHVLLGMTEEWIVKNMANQTTGPPNSAIDHPLHIHINPFQVTEMFDPNATFVDETTGTVLPRYVVGKDVAEGQCRLDPADRATWKPCRDTRQGHWWDVFAIPAGRAHTDEKTGEVIRDKDGEPIIFPGYFKMRSRFVDYPGLYVMHCHILIHEDRGMMFSVEVFRTKAGQVNH